MSEENKLTRPYPPAEAILVASELRNNPSLYKDRLFLLYSGRHGGYWHPSGEGYVGESRDESGVFSYSRASQTIDENTMLELLPVPIPAAAATMVAERDITYADLGKVGANRLCLLKDKEGRYCDGNLQQVMERSLAPVQRCSQLFGLAVVKPLTFELLVPADAETGGPEMQEVVCYAEAQRQDDTKRFLVKSVTPHAVSGYSYSNGRIHEAPRASAILLDKKELRRRYDDVPKAEIIIELLKPQPISKLEDFFNPAGLALIKASPNNELVRGFMLSKLKVMPPKEEDDFDKLKKWIEWNVSNKKSPAPVVEEAIPEPARTVADIQLHLRIQRQRTAIGRVNYSVLEAGQDDGIVTLDEMMEIAAESSSWANFRRHILELIDNNSEDNADYEEVGEKVLHDQETTDSRDHEVAWPSVSRADEALKAFMRQHMQEELERLSPPATPTTPQATTEDLLPTITVSAEGA